MAYRRPRTQQAREAPVVAQSAPRKKKKGGLFGKIGRGLAKVAKRVVAPVANAGLKKLQDMAISKISGMGDYAGVVDNLKSNAIIRPTMNDTVPAFSNISGGVQIAHREYIEDIYSSTDFLNRSYNINPAIGGTFPWLSNIAVNFEQYHIRGMIFEFKTGSSDALNSVNTALGYVVMTTEYNSLALPYTNKQQMENSQFCVSTKPSKSVIHPIECAPFQTPSQPLYTRLANGNFVAEGDKRLYDLGNFQLATVGMQQAGVNLGELWVSYIIDFYKPVLGSGLAFDARNSHYNLKNVVSANNLLAEPVVVFDTLGGSFDQNTYIFPPNAVGKYQVTYSIAGAESSALADFRDILSPYLGTVNKLNYWCSTSAFSAQDNISGYIPASTETNTVRTIFSWILEVPIARSDNSFKLAPNTIIDRFPADLSYGDLVIVQVNGNFH